MHSASRSGDHADAGATPSQQRHARSTVGPPGRITIRVMLVEDHWVWASAVEAHLSTLDGVDVVGVASTADEAISMADAIQPDVLLMGLVLRNDVGLRVARIIQARGSTARIAIITKDPSPWAVAEARRLGLQGLIAKEDLTSRDEVTRLIVDLAAGRDVASKSIRRMDPSDGLPYGLTAQEHEMIRCWAEGCGTPEIAARLCVGQQTVRNKTSVIGRKMGVTGRLEIVAKAVAERIISGASQYPG